MDYTSFFACAMGSFEIRVCYYIRCDYNHKETYLEKKKKSQEKYILVWLLHFFFLVDLHLLDLLVSFL